MDAVPGLRQTTQVQDVAVSLEAYKKKPVSLFVYSLLLRLLSQASNLNSNSMSSCPLSSKVFLL